MGWAVEIKAIERKGEARPGAAPCPGLRAAAAASAGAVLTAAAPALSSPQDVKKEVDSAIEKAKAADIPDLSTIWADVYADGLAMKLRGVDQSVMQTIS